MAITNRPPMRFVRKPRRPQFLVYRSSEIGRLNFRWNNLCGVTIGAAIKVGSRVFSLVWARAVPAKPSGGGGR